MVNLFKKMTPEEASKFRASGAKFMIIPFAIIIIIGMVFVFSTLQKSSNTELSDGLQNNDPSQIICHKDLQVCGSGCIPSNAVCCDNISGNSYCLWPDTLCKINPNSNGEVDRFICSNDETVKSFDCETGQVFCGMFCIDAGKRCCLGGVCDEEKIDNSPSDTISSFSGNWKTPGPVKFYKIEYGSISETIQRMSEINARSITLWITITDEFIDGFSLMEFISCDQLITYNGILTACIPQVSSPGGDGTYLGPLGFGSLGGGGSVKIVGNKLTSSSEFAGTNQDIVFTLVTNDPDYGGKDVLYVDLTSVDGGYDADPGTIVLIRQP